MLKNLSSAEQTSGKVSPVPDLALGHVWHGFLDYLEPPVSFSDGITVLVSGDIYDDDGLASALTELIADLYNQTNSIKLRGSTEVFVSLCSTSKSRVALITDRLATTCLFGMITKDY